MLLLGKSDPMCVVHVRTLDLPELSEQRTEKIENEPNPVFRRTFRMTYRFEEQQLLTFKIYDVDSEDSDLEDHKLLGFADCHLGQLVFRGEVGSTVTSRGIT